MKKNTLIVLAALLIAGCAGKKADKKAIFDSLMQTHEKVMGADEVANNNKLKLDTLLKQANFAGKDTAVLLSKKLTDADSAMTNWMHKFDPDFKGKTEDETVNYLIDQKKQIVAIDSSLNLAVSESTKYLSKTKKK